MSQFQRERSGHFGAWQNKILTLQNVRGGNRCLGCKGSWVRIPPRRPIISNTYTQKNLSFHYRYLPSVARGHWVPFGANSGHAAVAVQISLDRDTYHSIGQLSPKLSQKCASARGRRANAFKRGVVVRKTKGFFTVSIPNWDKFNPRKDVKHPSWLRLEHDFFTKTDFFSFKSAELLAWVYILTEASKASSSLVTLSVEHANKVGRIKPSDLASAIAKLKANGSLLEHAQSVTSKHVDVTDTCSTNERTDERNETNGRDETKPSAEADLHVPRLAEIWNQEAGKLPKVLACPQNSTRRKLAMARWRENPDEVYWREAIERIKASPFCSGKNDRGWRANFDWLIKPGTATKVLEGQYDGQGNKKPFSIKELLEEEEAARASA